MPSTIFFDFQLSSSSANCYKRVSSRLPLHVCQGRKRYLVLHPDRPESTFIFLDILLQRTEQPLGMFGHEDDARLHAGLRHARQHLDEVEDEFGTGMRDDGQVGIRALGHVFLPRPSSG